MGGKEGGGHLAPSVKRQSRLHIQLKGGAGNTHRVDLTGGFQDGLPHHAQIPHSRAPVVSLSDISSTGLCGEINLLNYLCTACSQKCLAEGGVGQPASSIQTRAVLNREKNPRPAHLTSKKTGRKNGHILVKMGRQAKNSLASLDHCRKKCVFDLSFGTWTGLRPRAGQSPSGENKSRPIWTDLIQTQRQKELWNLHPLHACSCHYFGWRNYIQRFTKAKKNAPPFGRSVLNRG